MKERPSDQEMTTVQYRIKKLSIQTPSSFWKSLNLVSSGDALSILCTPQSDFGMRVRVHSHLTRLGIIDAMLLSTSVMPLENHRNVSSCMSREGPEALLERAMQRISKDCVRAKQSLIGLLHSRGSSLDLSGWPSFVALPWMSGSDLISASRHPNNYS